VGHPAAGTTWTADVGIPLALTIGGATGTQIIPFVTPSFALVATSSAGSDIRAGRGLIGAGVSLFNAKSMLAASAGFQYVFVSNTQLQFGIALCLGAGDALAVLPLGDELTRRPYPVRQEKRPEV